MSKNIRITRDKQPKRNSEETIKVRMINKAIRDMIKNGHITQEFADENRKELVEQALRKLV
jgi:hypothetical protein